MAVHIPFTVQRLGLKHHFGLEQQLDDGIDLLALLISDLIQVIGVGEIDKEVGDIARHIQIRPTEVLSEAFLGQGAEKPTQRMLWRNLSSHRNTS
jgi:hypothetical protein